MWPVHFACGNGTVEYEKEASSHLAPSLACKVLSRKRKIKRSVWVWKIFARQREQGEFHHLLQEMRQDDPESHFRYLRMSKERFDLLLTMVSRINVY